MALAKLLLETLACPEDKGPLVYLESEQALYNPRLHRRYDIRDDIPVMLVEEATTAEDAGYRVGYQSPSQFSREYGRMFGEPPIKHATRLRRASAARTT